MTKQNLEKKTRANGTKTGQRGNGRRQHKEQGKIKIACVIAFGEGNYICNKTQDENIFLLQNIFR